MAIIDNTWTEKFGTNQKIWVSDMEHQHVHHFPTSGPAMGAGKYEGLPNFVGGLYVDKGILMLKKSDDSSIMLGKVGDQGTIEELMYNIIDEIYSD